MPSSLSFRSGQVALQKFRVEATSVVEPGDLIYLDETVIRPAREITWNVDLATTQQSFANAFVGIAHEQSANGDDDPLSVDVSATSIYEFDVTSSTFEFGNALGPEGGASVLLDQQLAFVGTNAQAVARAMEFTDQMVTRLRVSFASAYTTASSNTNATVG